jgi:hypothetical protein
MEAAMSGLGPDARSLIDAASEADGPSSDDAARVRAKLVRRLSVAAAAGTAATVGATGTAGATGLAFTTKVLLAAAVVGGTLATTAIVLRPPAPTLDTQKVVEEKRASGNPWEQERNLSSPAALERLTTGERSSPAAPERLAKPLNAEKRLPAKPKPDDDVAGEAALIRAAHAALARGDGAEALSALDRHTARYPHGALVEERQAARVFALCASGRVAEARDAAAAFVGESPRSPMVAQVRRACVPRSE